MWFGSWFPHWFDQRSAAIGCGVFIAAFIGLISGLPLVALWLVGMVGSHRVGQRATVPVVWWCGCGQAGYRFRCIWEVCVLGQTLRHGHRFRSCGDG